MRRKYGFIALLLITTLCSAQQDSSKKVYIKFGGGYELPLMAGDFTKYYGGCNNSELFLGYSIKPQWSIGLGIGYCLFPMNKLNDYVTNNINHLVVSNPAIPFTDLVGGSINIISMQAELNRIFSINKLWEAIATFTPSYSFIEKAPIDGNDALGEYQILQHYVHEKALGFSIGGGINYALGPSYLIGISLNYNMLLTSSANNQSMGILNPKVSILIKL